METLAMFSAAQPNGFYRMSAHGTAELVTGVPMALMNGVFSITPEADHEEVAAFAASPNLESVAWSIQVRGEQPDPRIVRTAAAHGLEQRSTLPLMIKDLAEDDAEVSEGSTLRVRAVSGDDGDLYRTMLAAGFEGPADIFSAFTSSSIMDHVSMQGYIVESEGVPVATSFGVRVADQVGVFNIAVPPQHRRRGYGRAATAAVLRDAYLDGAHTAFLHASPMGVPLYEAMGFRMAEHWTVFSS
ncbi:GNAT family N-acetyltransferase [Streptomyces sp. NPDC001177]